jgi:hypothetical protein
VRHVGHLPRITTDGLITQELAVSFIEITKGIFNLDCFRHGHTTIDYFLHNEPRGKASLGTYLIICACPAMPSATVRPI